MIKRGGQIVICAGNGATRNGGNGGNDHIKDGYDKQF